MEKIKIDFSKYVTDDRTPIADLLLNAINCLIEPQEDFTAAIRQIAEYHENLTGDFPVLTVKQQKHSGFAM